MHTHAHVHMHTQTHMHTNTHTLQLHRRLVLGALYLGHSYGSQTYWMRSYCMC